MCIYHSYILYLIFCSFLDTCYFFFLKPVLVYLQSARFKRAQQKAFAKNNFATLFALEKQETEMQRKVK